jgi:tetratricopeptide (TPR) repeat protein
MMRRLFFKNGPLLAAMMLSSLAAPSVGAQDTQQQQSQQPQYTIPEYNAFQACRSEKGDPQIKCLDDFVAKFPNSTLMPYIYQLYYPAYAQLKNYKKTIEYIDKLLAMGDKVDATARLQAIQARLQVFPFAFDAKASDAHDQLIKEKNAAQQGITLLQNLKKPADLKMSEEDFEKQKKVGLAAFEASAGFVDLQLKDNASAAKEFRDSLAANPAAQDAAVTEYRLGLAHLGMNPPQSLDGFWALARAVDLKVPDADKITDYLRKSILAYEQPTCDSLVDPQLKELLQLAQNSPERPSSYTIPSAADLQKIAGSSTILTVMSDLKAGGDKAKMTWLAICGAEFPEVVGKVIDVVPPAAGSNVVELHLYTGATPEEMQSATTANMDVKVVGQPEAARLQKDDGARFKGTILAYDPEPFMLHWDKATVNPEDIPAEKGGRRTPHKVPGKPGKQ